MIKKCEVVTEFEITKQSASASFDDGWNPDSIFAEIEIYSNYKVPENLKINISEWYTSYSSAILYHGYVLKVTENNINFAENNPNIKKYIKEKLAPGIYLLNVPAHESVDSFIDEARLSFVDNSSRMYSHFCFWSALSIKGIMKLLFQFSNSFS